MKNNASLQQMAAAGNRLHLALPIIIVLLSAAAIFLLTGKLAAKQAALATATELAVQIEQSAGQISAQGFDPASLLKLPDHAAVRLARISAQSTTGEPATLIAEKYGPASPGIGWQLFGYTLQTQRLLALETPASQPLLLELHIHRAFLPQWHMLGTMLVVLVFVLLALAWRYRGRSGHHGKSAYPPAPPESGNSSHSATIGSSPEEKQLLQKTELQLANERALEANRFKTQLIATTSHELLTPLNSVIGFAELLKERQQTGQDAGESDDQSARYLQYILENAGQLKRLVNDLVVYADQQKRQLSLNYSSVDLYDFLESVSSSLSSETLSKGLQFNREYASIKGLHIDTDTVRLRQILYNLIVNAIRHTEAGSVTLSAEAIASDSQSKLKLSVSDTGCGIDADQQQHLFSDFVRQHETAADEYAPGLGLGLGLSIVSHLTALLGGEVALQSSLGKGSCFTVTLPLRASQTVPPRAQPISSTYQEYPPLELLVVDDNRSNALLVREQLRQFPWSIDEATDGDQAIARAAAHNYDLVLLDIRMQPLDGYQVFEAIRAQDQHRLTPILACTAHTSDSEYQKLLQFGFADVLHKPLEPELLRTSIARSCGIAVDTESIAPATFSKVKTETGLPGQHFDSATALRRAGQNADIAQQVFTLLVEDLATLREKHPQVQALDQESLLDVVHQIHGSASLSGTTRLKSLAADAEQRLKDSGMASANSSIKELFNYLDEFLAWCSENPASEIFKES